MEDGKVFDILIIGGGPAGYTAALYGARAGLSTAVIERYAAGGQMCLTSTIDNYPGVEAGIDGYSLGQRMRAAAEASGAVTIETEVKSASLGGRIKSAVTDKGTLSGRTIIIATGAKHRQLGIEREEELTGSGVGYCAVCDGMLYKGKVTAVVGGGDSAAADALYLSKICSKVILVHRGATLRAKKIYAEQLAAAENVEIRLNSVVSALSGGELLDGIRVKGGAGTEEDIPCDGLFVCIGRTPETDIFAGQLELSEGGYIAADESTRTSSEGVFAAGDVRTKSVRQIVTATADGAAAVHFAEEYLSGR